jgi:hypothetical protein
LSSPIAQRVKKRREALRAAGLRPLQIWVPDARRPGFADQCRRQAERVASADAADRELQSFMEAAFTDLDRSAE